MKQTKSPTWADSMKAAASILKTSLECVREAKASGCSAFRGGRVRLADLRTWLGKQGHRRKHTATAPLPDVGSDQKGAVAALHRLESAEAAAYVSLSSAITEGDADRIAGARRNWLSISESLRKFDLAVEDHRRKTGELVSRSEIEAALSALGYCLRLASEQVLPQVTRAARGAVDDIAARQMFRRANYDVAVVSYGFLSALGVKEWLVKSLSNDFTAHTTMTPADIARYATIIKQGVDALSAQTIADVKGQNP